MKVIFFWIRIRISAWQEETVHRIRFGIPEQIISHCFTHITVQMGILYWHSDIVAFQFWISLQEAISQCPTVTADTGLYSTGKSITITQYVMNSRNVGIALIPVQIQKQFSPHTQNGGHHAFLTSLACGLWQFMIAKPTKSFFQGIVME